MSDPRAGQPAQPSDLVDVAHLVTAYYTTWPDLADPGQRVVFGTSGHRGSSLAGAFTEAHIVATMERTARDLLFALIAIVLAYLLVRVLLRRQRRSARAA